MVIRAETGFALSHCESLAVWPQANLKDNDPVMASGANVMDGRWCRRALVLGRSDVESF